MRTSASSSSVTDSKPGYLHEPDDAYLLKSGEDKRMVQSFREPSGCFHDHTTRTHPSTG